MFHGSAGEAWLTSFNFCAGISRIKYVVSRLTPVGTERGFSTDKRVDIPLRALASAAPTRARNPSPRLIHRSTARPRLSRCENHRDEQKGAEGAGGGDPWK